MTACTAHVQSLSEEGMTPTEHDRSHHSPPRCEKSCRHGSALQTSIMLLSCSSLSQKTGIAKWARLRLASDRAPWDTSLPSAADACISHAQATRCASAPHAAPGMRTHCVLNHGSHRLLGCQSHDHGVNGLLHRGLYAASQLQKEAFKLSELHCTSQSICLSASRRDEVVGTYSSRIVHHHRRNTPVACFQGRRGSRTPAQAYRSLA